MKVLILVDYFKEEAAKLIPELTKWFSERDILAIVLRPGEEIESSQKFDFAVLLGGDGFITKKSLVLARLNLPFLGINFGIKGFLAVAKKDNWQEMLEKVLAGKYTIEKRMVLAATHFGGNKHQKFEAAGDIYIRHRTNMIAFSVVIAGEVIYKNLLADGVVVATSTGSTGYNLSAGGPYCQTGIVVTPICPHAVNVKPLSLQESKKIEIVYLETKAQQEEDEGCLLFVDGTRYLIEPGDKVQIRNSRKKASFIIPEGFSFFEALQEKLGLSK